MTPKEKAKELAMKYYNEMNPNQPDCSISYNQTKQCALIAVEELIRATPSINGRPPNYQEINEYCCEYWQQVKQEIEKL